MDQMVGKLEGNPFVGMLPSVEGYSHHGGFKINEVEGIDPGIHLPLQVVPIDPGCGIPRLVFFDLEPPSFTGRNPRFPIGTGIYILNLKVAHFNASVLQ